MNNVINLPRMRTIGAIQPSDDFVEGFLFCMRAFAKLTPEGELYLKDPEKGLMQEMVEYGKALTALKEKEDLIETIQRLLQVDFVFK